MSLDEIDFILTVDFIIILLSKDCGLLENSGFGCLNVLLQLLLDHTVALLQNIIEVNLTIIELKPQRAYFFLNGLTFDLGPEETSLVETFDVECEALSYTHDIVLTLLHRSVEHNLSELLNCDL